MSAAPKGMWLQEFYARQRREEILGALKLARSPGERKGLERRLKKTEIDIGLWQGRYMEAHKL